MDKAADAAPLGFIRGTGEMATRVRAFDWASTPLGPAVDWPTELKAAVGLILDTRFASAVLWGPQLTTLYNDAFRPILGGKREALGRPFSEVWAEVWEQIGPLLERVYRDGEPIYLENFELLIDRFDRPERAWFTFCYSPLRLLDGTVAGVVDTVVETTEMMKAREQLVLFNEELAHRLKNTLAIVQALAAQTFKGVGDREAVKAFDARVVAMSRAHDILSRKNWSGAALGEAAKAALSPFTASHRIGLDGPEVAIGPRVTVALTLVLHEFATNAAKYGALSTPAGRVRLSWQTDGETLRVRWRETGGPEVREPTKTGFGSRLVDMGLGTGCTVERRYPPAGFEADLAYPVKNLLID